MDLDLENGNGGGNNDSVAVLRCPDRADPNNTEPQPMTWLRSAPYIAATLAGVALIAASIVVLGDRSCSTQCDWVAVPGLIGVGLVGIAGSRALSALFDFECCLPRLEDDR